MSVELKELAAERIVDFLGITKNDGAALGSIEEELSMYRLTETEWQAAWKRAGYPDDALSQQ